MKKSDQQQTTQPQTQTIIFSNYTNNIRPQIQPGTYPEIDCVTDTGSIFDKDILPINKNLTIQQEPRSNQIIGSSTINHQNGFSQKKKKVNKRIMVNGENDQIRISSRILPQVRAQTLSPENGGASLINYYNKSQPVETNSLKQLKSSFRQNQSNNSTIKFNKVQSLKELNTQNNLNSQINVRASLKQLIQSNQQTQAQLSEIANSFKAGQKQQLIQTQKRQKNRFIQKISSQKELSNPQNYKIVTIPVKSEIKQQQEKISIVETVVVNQPNTIGIQNHTESMKSSGVSQVQSSSRSIVPKLNLEKVMQLKKIFSPDIQAAKVGGNGKQGFSEKIEELKQEEDFITQQDIMLANEEIQKLKNEISQKNLILSQLLADSSENQKYKKVVQSSSPPKFRLNAQAQLPVKIKQFNQNNFNAIRQEISPEEMRDGTAFSKNKNNKTMKSGVQKQQKLINQKRIQGRNGGILQSQKYDNNSDESSKSLAYRGVTERIDSKGNVERQKKLIEYSPEIKNNFFEESFYKEKMKSRQKPQNLKLINNNHRRNDSKNLGKQQSNLIQEPTNIKNKRNSIFSKNEELRQDWERKNMLQKQEQIKNTLELIQGNLNMIKGFKGSESRSNSRKPRQLEPLNINQNNNIQIQLNLNFPKIQIPTNLDPQRRAFKNSKSPPIVLRRDQIKIFKNPVDPNIIIQKINAQEAVQNKELIECLQKDFEGIESRIRESLYSLDSLRAQPNEEKSSGRTPNDINQKAMKMSQVSSAFPDINTKSIHTQSSHRQKDYHNPVYEILPNHHFDEKINIYNSSLNSNPKKSKISQNTAQNFNRNVGSRSMPEITPRDIQFRRDKGYKPSFNRQHKFDEKKIIVNPELRDMEQKDREINQPIQLKKILNHGKISDRVKNRNINPNERDEEICNFEMMDNPPPINLFERVFRDSIPIMIVDDKTDESFKSSNPSKTNSRLSRYNNPKHL
ncbi:UNKNOWN [Stylonychia lemnae]|uniref:Uncharacterized protein n=1 Tax=Stylonychia lemnae TaxID=5949 RepID=A0A078B5E6_STYLE|nr:UNKNOWN [Stylonychia lemnae]|eukprot:CDW89649.1 UNKNOWN [Stylonychia lemnae]